MKEYIVTNYINDSNGDTIGERRFTIPQETVNEIRTDERARMLEPYDVESIEELIQNVRAKAIEEMYAKTKEMIDVVCKGDTRPHFAWDIIFRELWVGLDKVAEQMKGDKE